LYTLDWYVTVYLIISTPLTAIITYKHYTFSLRPPPGNIVATGIAIHAANAYLFPNNDLDSFSNRIVLVKRSVKFCYILVLCRLCSSLSMTVGICY